MADQLPGYTFDRSSARYRNSSTGRFVARRDIIGLLNNQVQSGEQRLRDLTTEFHEGKLSASVWSEQMRSEVKRQHLQQASLGAGGWDRLDQRDYGRIGGNLRAEYRNIERFARQVQAGDVTLPQALQRADGYVGGSRIEFFETERRAAQNAAQTRGGASIIERRHLDPSAQHCRDCPGYYDRGWQAAGMLPVPGVACQCRHHCRCRMSRREVPTSELGDWIGSKR